MMIDHILTYAIPAAYSLLPPVMTSEKATAMLIAIGLQESAFSARRQRGGPAHGFWMFERGGGLKGVLTHPRSQPAADVVIDALCYRVLTNTLAQQGIALFEGLTHNDTLACAFARLLLWTLPAPLPGPDDETAAWGQYLAAWRPGRPRPDVWSHNYGEAWARVKAASQS